MIGRSMLAYIPVNLANLIVSFGTVVILTRLLGADEFGRYAIATVTMHAVHMAIFTWLEAAMARFQARAEREDNVKHHLKTIYVYAMAIAAGAFSLVIAITNALPLEPLMKTLMMFALGTTCVQVLFNLGMEAHKAAHRIRRYSSIFSFHTLFSFSIGIILILTTPLREVAPFIGIITSLLIVLAIDLPFMFKRMRGGQLEPARGRLYFSYGMPICISLLLAYALNSADVYLIAAMMGEAATGQYSAGYNLSNRSVEVLFAWIAMAVTPLAVTAMEKEGEKRSTEIMREYVSTLLWLTLPAATGIALVSREFGFILGENVREQAITVMPLIAFAGVLNGLISYYAQRAFMLSGKTMMFVWAMIPPVIINIALNIWLIPIHGLLGAVYATVASYTFGLLVAIFVGRQYYPLPLPFKSTAQIALACAAMAAVVMVLPISPAIHDLVALAIKAVIGAGVYASVCLAINAANCRDILKRTWTKIRPGSASLKPAGENS